MSGFNRARRILAAAGVLAVGCIAVTPAWAQEFPSRPLKMVVPFGAGTTTDIVARTVADGLSKQLLQQVIVENRAGGGGAIGVSAVARSASDGYTLVMGTSSTHGSNPTLYKSLPYDVMKDFIPIVFAGYSPNLLIVAANSPFHTLADLKTAAAKPPGVTFASAGSGTTGHLAAELLKTKLGGEMVHVPYKEGGKALTDVIAGQTNFMFYHPAAVMPHIQSGRLRALASSGMHKNAAAPDVLPVAQQGYPDFDLVSWFMLYAPAGTPQPVVHKLRAAAAAAMKMASVADKFTAQGIDTRTLTGDEMTAFNRSEIAKWGAIVQRSGATAD